MSYLIAITGKGGVGKTTIAALLINRLIKKDRKPVLAVDADPNTCLDAALGVSVEKTVGGVREEAREIAGKGMSSGISKQQLLEMKIAQCLVEAKDFDLIAMGRPEGPGCYCYANNVLKSVLTEISKHYPYIVLDNEAGLENLSRRIVQKVDLLVMVTDPSQRGLETVSRLHSLALEMETKYHQLAIIVNRLRNEELPSQVKDLKERIKADFVVGLPNNDQLAALSEKGLPLLNLEPGNPVIGRLDAFIEKLPGGALFEKTAPPGPPRKNFL
ncbi:MAG: AAA family ATPase [Candidatus Aminicenantes bacterium]|nr:MAG: AAA family ATPase [Candidatus Aminicenantes bacterium]